MQTSSKKSRLISIEKVEGNDELLMAILILLPPKSIFKFKSVSKRWNNIIVDPYFIESYSARTRNEKLCGGIGRLLAFVQARSRCSRMHVPGPQHLINVLAIAQLNEHKIKPLPFEFGHFLHCSDGLILCKNKNIYYVVNPLTRTWVPLPPHPNTYRLGKIGLVCDENTQKLEPSFRVVGINMNYDRVEDGKTMVIETYSSKTGEWTTSTLVGTEELNLTNFQGPFVHKGVFHWSTELPAIAVYDSNGNENSVRLIKLPPDIRNYPFTFTRSSTDDLLWVGASNRALFGNSSRERIQFWMLPKDAHGSYKRATTIAEDEWILMHTINNASVCKDMALLLESKKRKKILDTIFMGATDLKLEALIPSNPVIAVLNLRQKKFLYNLESKSIELVRYRGRPFGYKCISSWHPFMESLSLSTYAPFANAYSQLFIEPSS